MREKISFFTGEEHQPFKIGQGVTGVLMLHGFMGTPAEMRPLAERIAAAGHVAYGPLLPGFGPDIERLGEVSRNDWLNAVRVAWQEIRATHEETILIGFSMGGALAVNIAAAEAPDGVALLAPFWRLGGWQFRLLPLLKRIKPSVAPFENANFDDQAVRHQIEALAPDIDLDDPDTQRYLRESVRLPLQVLDEVRRLGKMAWSAAPAVASPVLILQGEEDLTVLPADTRRLAKRLTAPVNYCEVPAGHQFVRLEPEQPDISREVLSFIEQNRPKPGRV